MTEVQLCSVRIGWVLSEEIKQEVRTVLKARVKGYLVSGRTLACVDLWEEETASSGRELLSLLGELASEDQV